MKYEMLKKSLEKENFFYTKRSNTDPIFIFYKKIVKSVELVNFVERKSKKNDIKLDARKNYIINLVTAAEVYFKDLVKLLPEFEKVKKCSGGIRELLDEKITIWEAFQLLRSKKTGSSIRLGDIVSATNSFQNLLQIDYVFSSILSIKFLYMVEQHKKILNEYERKFFKVDILHLKSNLPQWRKHVASLFDTRHDIVHQICFTDKLSYKQISRFWWNLVCFVYAVDYFVRDRYL